MNYDHEKIAVIGLGYVGLPLAVEFGKLRPVIGFDHNRSRVLELQSGSDMTMEVSAEEMECAKHLTYKFDSADLDQCKIFIVTVPTPVDIANRPNLQPLEKASEIVGKAMQVGSLIIYESTVFPGATEEVCVPILGKISGSIFNQDFFCGYSPERINPGDKLHRLSGIKKVTSGSTVEIADVVDRLYRQIITAGTHKASSIKVAEAAKVIENTQRDVNIALMNELSLIFHRLGIDTLEVLQAAETKWNFLPFRPGLVGGHCIGVDPYYLTHKALEVGYHSEVILAGRRINDSMAAHVADRLIKLMLKNNIQVLGSPVLVLGLTFKEDCPDVRNTKVIDLVRALKAYRTVVDVFDPLADPSEVSRLYDVDCLRSMPQEGQYSAVVLAVGHKQFVELGAAGIRAFGAPDAVVFDVKSLLPLGSADGRL